MSALSMETFTAGVDTAQEPHQVVTPTVTQEQFPFYLLLLLATASAVVNSKAILGAAVFNEMPRGHPGCFILFLLLDRGLEASCSLRWLGGKVKQLPPLWLEANAKYPGLLCLAVAAGLSWRACSLRHMVTDLPDDPVGPLFWEKLDCSGG